MRMIAALAGLVALGACSTTDITASIENLDLLAETRRAFAESYQDQPFEAGAIYVIAAERGDMQTYRLRPCQGSTRICGDTGGVGQLVQTPDSDVVSGAYPDRVFVLTPGGGGTLRWHGADWPLAWE